MFEVSNQTATALNAAQASRDRFSESEAVAAIVPTGRYRGNDRDGRAASWRFMLKVAFGAGDCWYWTGAKHKLGYGLTGKGKAHRVSWEMFCGPIPDGQNVLHRCDVRACVNPEHLFLGTQADNVRDMVAKGRRRSGDVRGESNPQSRLTREKVLAMRRIRLETGASYRAIAEQFGVTTMTAQRAITGTSWSNV